MRAAFAAAREVCVSAQFESVSIVISIGLLLQHWSKEAEVFIEDGIANYVPILHEGCNLNHWER